MAVSRFGTDGPAAVVSRTVARSRVTRPAGGAMADYVTPDQLAAQLGIRDISNPRLAQVCAAASDSIDSTIGVTTRLAPVPGQIAEVALSLAVDWWKQPDATFGILGLSETGPVRIGRDLIARYMPVLVNFTEPAGWGIA